jgi:hypothetical protein
MNLQKTTTRRALLKTALGMGVALGIGARARAFVPSPFTPNVPWTGQLTVAALGYFNNPIELTVNDDGVTGALTVRNTSNTATIAFLKVLSLNVANSVATIVLENGALISGNVGISQNTGSPALQPFGSYINNGSLGTVTLLRSQLQGLVATSLPIDGGVVSVEIFPPDWLGRMIVSGSPIASGPMRFQPNIPAAGPLPAFSQIRGLAVLNGVNFATTMTFSPTASSDGSYAFDLVGDSGRGLVMLMSGRFVPAVKGTLAMIPAQMLGTFQLFTSRGSSAGVGSFALRTP